MKQTPGTGKTSRLKHPSAPAENYATCSDFVVFGTLIPILVVTEASELSNALRYAIFQLKIKCGVVNVMLGGGGFLSVMISCFDFKCCNVEGKVLLRLMIVFVIL